MGKLPIKPEYEAELKRLGVYLRWCKNFRKCCVDNCFSPITIANDIYTSSTFHQFICRSFYLYDTPEKWDFWNDVANGRKPLKP